MSDGKTHDKIWRKYRFTGVLAGTAMSVILSSTGVPPVVSIGVGVSTAAGYGLARVIGPDLDLVGINGQESLMMNSLGIFGVLIVMWFLPYAYIMRFVGIGRKGHRNFFSHTPGISSFIRQRWLFLGPDIVVALYGSTILFSAYMIIMGGMLIGMTIADFFHYLADVLPSRKIKSML